MPVQDSYDLAGLLLPNKKGLFRQICGLHAALKSGALPRAQVSDGPRKGGAPRSVHEKASLAFRVG